MSETNADNLHKEFELERMILFSDAVFAIAITLLIIEIKFPELPDNSNAHYDLWAMFKPVVRGFVGFIISFIIIGVNWAFHLNTFRHLRAYDSGLIARNLLGLLFVVSFPFAAAGITHMRPSFMIPLVIYIGNIAMIGISNFILAYYIFKQRPQLTKPGNEAEKKYIYLLSKTQGIGMGLAFLVILGTAIVTHNDNLMINYSGLAVVPAGFALRFVRMKYKPKK